MGRCTGATRRQSIIPVCFTLCLFVFPLVFHIQFFHWESITPTLFHFLFVFSLFFCIHSISFIGSGQVYQHKEAIHPSAHFVPNKACNCVRNKIHHLFLLHALKAPSSDRLRPGLLRWAKSVMGPKSSRDQNISQDIYVDLYMSSFCRTNFKIVLQFIKW